MTGEVLHVDGGPVVSTKGSQPGGAELRCRTLAVSLPAAPTQRVESSVNLDVFEKSCPYFMSPDVAAARRT